MMGDPPYLANTLGSTPNASLIMMGVCGLCFFIVGYVRVRNELRRLHYQLWWPQRAPRPLL